MPSDKEIAGYLKSLANSERTLKAMGSEFAEYAAEILEAAAKAIWAGMVPSDVVARLKDLSADLATARADIQAKADEKFGK